MRGRMTPAAIAIQDLSKTYQGGKRALDGVTFDVPRGQIFGLLGPNGAGKSTLINILAGLVNKTGGKVSIWGFDIDAHPRNAKASIGIVNQEIIFDPFFTPKETLEIQAGLYGVARDQFDAMELLRAVHLEDKADAYSHALGRHEAPADGGQGDGAFAAGAGARRADRGRGRRAAPAALGLCAPAQPARGDGGADHSLSRGSRAIVRPDRDHQPWQADRQQADARAGGDGAGKRWSRLPSIATWRRRRPIPVSRRWR